MLNAGHKRGGCAFRCEGGGNALRGFKAFAPAALAGIGFLPPTLHDRSIIIPLLKAQPGQTRARFNEQQAETEKILARKLARWAKDNFAPLAACDPPLPPCAFNRLADNWRPLFAVAQVAGGDWPQRAADAFAKLTTKNPHPATVNPQLLLADIRSIFAEAGADRLFSTAIVDRLLALPGRPWSRDQNGHNPVDQSWLARQLRPFGVYPHTLRIGAARGRGYILGHFTHAFAHFLP